MENFFDPEDTESEWKLFRRVIVFVHHRARLFTVLSTLIGTSDIVAALSKLAAILMVVPITTATVERTFST